jgi:hypothetical protein
MFRVPCRSAAAMDQPPAHVYRSSREDMDRTPTAPQLGVRRESVGVGLGRAVGMSEK